MPVRLRTNWRDGESPNSSAQEIQYALARIAKGVGDERLFSEISQNKAFSSSAFLVLNTAAERFPLILSSVPLRFGERIIAYRFNAICRDINTVLDYLDTVTSQP